VKKIVIWANKGGVGKTTSVINIASALTKIGKKVLTIYCAAQEHPTRSFVINTLNNLTLSTLTTDNFTLTK
jgi:cellulose biosynthesis protein BcsQ